MIDDFEKTVAPVARMRDALPIPATITAALRSMLEQSAKQAIPPDCSVAEVGYLGDEGGIACTLEFESEAITNRHVVSITHLKFARRHPPGREIEAYCRHRIKRIKKLHGRMAAT